MHLFDIIEFNVLLYKLVQKFNLDKTKLIYIYQMGRVPWQLLINSLHLF
jgi:hypothetical protein